MNTLVEIVNGPYTGKTGIVTRFSDNHKYMYVLFEEPNEYFEEQYLTDSADYKNITERQRG